MDPALWISNALMGHMLRSSWQEVEIGAGTNITYDSFTFAF